MKKLAARDFEDILQVGHSFHPLELLDCSYPITPVLDPRI